MFRPPIKKPPFKLKVKKSKAGLGLFAEEKIPKGRIIIEYFGDLINRDEADKRGGKYLFDISDRFAIDGTTRKNTARYINHSCRPNCETDVVKSRIFVYAKRNIKEGEELCYDYGKSYFNEFIKPYGCRCNKCSIKQK